MVNATRTASKISKFLSVYAEIRPDYDPEFDDEDERFTSPDASILFTAQKLLEIKSTLPFGFNVNSSWDSGGYLPYTDPVGRSLHEQINASFYLSLVTLPVNK